ncbi:MAG: MmcQ/YjbR family DNA-binding protein [Owenweeksia sp.]|nr:MmcQ/YjbR family DNA-binding protein [Owenweeksia sp.]
MKFETQYNIHWFRMNIEELRAHCLHLPQATEGMPFGEGSLVFKVGGKMFALASLNGAPLRINLKCEPNEALQIRESYPAVIPGYHMNKKHWNTVILDGSIADAQLVKWISTSYQLVFKSLPLKTQAIINNV